MASESLVLAVSCALAMSVGGGDMLRMNERWRESSTWAFLLWLGARWGRAGTGSVAAAGLLEKKSGVSVVLARPNSENGVMGVTGLRSEEVSAVKKLVPMLEKSLSLWIELAEDEVVSDAPDAERMSGALRA